MSVIPYVRATHSDGQSFSAAKANVIETGLTDLSYAPAVHVFHSSNQTITTGTLTALAFNSERHDQAGGVASTMHDTATNNSRLTCRYAGVYIMGGTVDWENVTAGTYRQLLIRYNGTLVIDDRTAPQGTATGLHRQGITTSTVLAVNDYIELCVAHDRGSGLVVNSAANYSPDFWMVRVG